jgi:hypothetical protein
MAVTAICNPAFSGTVDIRKQTVSLEGREGVTSTLQHSNSISYSLGASYNVDDKVTFAFTEGALSSATFPSSLITTNLDLELVSDEDSSATYKVTTARADSIGDVIYFPAVEYTVASVLAGDIGVTVYSETAAGVPLDSQGTRTVLIAEAKSQFGGATVSSLFDNVINNDADSTVFVTETFDTLTWAATNPETIGWMNMAWVEGTVVVLQGEPGKMSGLSVDDFSAAGGTLSFDAEQAKLSVSYDGMMSWDSSDVDILFTPSGTSTLEDQAFKIDVIYNYLSSARVSGSAQISNRISAGSWTLVTPEATAPSALLSTSVTLNHAYNSLNGAFCDLDDVLDPGETSSITIKLANSGSGAVSGIKAQVTSTADITFSNDGMVEFADTASARDMVSAMLEVTLNNAIVDEEVDVLVTFMSDNSNAILPSPVTTSIKVNKDYNKDRSIEDFSSAETTWVDWQHSEVSAIEDSSKWQVSDDTDSVILGPNLATANDISLLSPTVTVSESGAFSITFDHSYQFEMGSDGSTWDGGVIEVSIDGGDWTDVIVAGGEFTTGYNGTVLSTNPTLGDRSGFVGESSGPNLVSETLTFEEGSINNKNVQLRFRIGSDNEASATGWRIDNFKFSNITELTPFSSIVADSGVCVNRAPLLQRVTGPASAAEATEVTLTAQGQDHDAGNLNYSWTQTAGTTSINTYTNSATLTFDVPAVEVDETYTFSVIASDVEFSSQAQEVSVIVTVAEVETPPVVESASGGSMGLFTLLLAPLCFFRLRKRG